MVFLHMNKNTRLNLKKKKTLKISLVVRNTLLSPGLIGIKAQVVGLNWSSSGAVNRRKAGRGNKRSHFHKLLLSDCCLITVMYGRFGPRAKSEACLIPSFACCAASVFISASSFFPLENERGLEGEGRQTGSQKFADWKTEQQQQKTTLGPSQTKAPCYVTKIQVIL